MNTAALFETLTAHGIRLETDGTALVASPSDRLTPDHRAEIIAHKSELIAYLTAANDDQATPHRRWLVRYQDGTELSITRCPPATLEQVATDYPSGPVRPDPEPPPGRPLDPEALAIIGAWLDAIGETDPVTRAEYVDGCTRDLERLRNTYDAAVALGIAALD